MKVNNIISSERKKKIWEYFKNSRYIDGEADAFMQLCDGYTPKGSLKWLMTNTGRDNGSFSGVSLIHFLKKLSIDFGEKNSNMRTAVCFFQNNEGKPLTSENFNPYLQNYLKVKSSNPLIQEIELLFSNIDTAVRI